jgi:hypothetical protein
LAGTVADELNCCGAVVACFYGFDLGAIMPRSMWRRATVNPAVAIRLRVVHGVSFVILVLSAAARFPQSLFMTIVVQRSPKSDQVPVHVLIVVVGKYLVSRQDLPDAGAFAQEIVDFWLHADRTFPDRQSLASIRVLASDPISPVTIVGDGSHVVDLPTFDNVKAALLSWAGQIGTAGVGFLNWVGHGADRVRAGGTISNLFCHGPIGPNSNEQAALDWAKTLNVIDGMTAGQPVYCFIDACRRLDLSQKEYEGIGVCDWKIPDNAYVFTTTSPFTPAFWVTRPKDAAIRAGCKGQAMGTRAYMAGLEGLGARYASSLPMPIASSELVEAAQALLKRWARHQGLTPGRPRGPSGAEPRSILLTDKPGSVADLTGKGLPPQASCEAQPDGSPDEIAAENGPDPFEFRLARKRHRFRYDDKVWSAPEELFHPHMRF